jgi:hypothetical protein
MRDAQASAPGAETVYAYIGERIRVSAEGAEQAGKALIAAAARARVAT